MAGSPEYKLGKLGGRFVVTWWEGDRRRRHRLDKGLTAPQASAELDSFVRDRTKLLDAGVVTIADLFEAYLADRKADDKRVEKQGFCWKALKPMFGHLKPSDIDKKVCRDFVKARTAAGRSEGTSWTDLSVLRAAVNWAAKAKKIPAAPFVFLPAQP